MKTGDTVDITFTSGAPAKQGVITGMDIDGFTIDDNGTKYYVPKASPSFVKIISEA